LIFRRIWRLVAVLVATVLLTTGCVKLEMDMTVAKDDTVSGTMVFALAKSIAGLADQGAESGDSLATDGLFADPNNVSIEPYDDGAFVGTSYTFKDIPLAQLAPEVGDSSSFAIKRQGDNLVVSGILDTSSEGESLEENPLGDSFIEGIAASTSIRITVTLPGEILETNGVIDGQSITWTGKFGEKLDIQAVAVSPLQEPINWLVFGGLIGLLLAIAAGAVAFLLTRKKSADLESASEAKAAKSSKPPKEKKLSKQELLAVEAKANRPWYQKKRFALPAVGFVAVSLLAIALGLLLPKSSPNNTAQPGSGNQTGPSASAFPEASPSPSATNSASGSQGTTQPGSSQPAPAQPAPAPVETKVEVPPPPANRVPAAVSVAPSETYNQMLAREDALYYWSENWWSRSGLIYWLADVGHSLEDATYGVDALQVDWNQEASGMANAKLAEFYFSRLGLIYELEAEGFSRSQATFGVDSLSYDWYAEAYNLAWDYVQIQGYSQLEAYNLLIADYFTADEADYGSYWAANP
jgi:hypothetical protein